VVAGLLLKRLFTQPQTFLGHLAITLQAFDIAFFTVFVPLE
jgi:hypothetical protein